MDLLVNKTSIMSYQCDLLSLSQSLIITHTHTQNKHCRKRRLHTYKLATLYSETKIQSTPRQTAFRNLEIQ